ncbi:TlpA family protein disulfide reductase [Ancylobacter pratisalsi]|uniref:TlpA family protein disulfide reductase n=1 Tax=Ancylobacter pratisalsi TaxID=1745854 RepID=UPI001FE68FDF|nr:TlpA disulfide reductase family protein [Ancylobacter pratisalsi]
MLLHLSLATDAGAQTLPDSPLPRGEPTPPVALESLDHGPQTLAALQGRVVLVHFFATWCEPCREEMAALTRLAGRMTDRPFDILAVDVGEPFTRIRRFFAADPVPFPILIDEDRATKKAWKVEFFPTSYLLAADHRLALYAVGPVDWDSPAALEAIEPLLSGIEAPERAPVLPPLPETPGSKP